MSMLNMFNTIDSIQPIEQTFDEVTLENNYINQGPDINSISGWVDQYNGIGTLPMLYNTGYEGLISDYPTSNWGAISPVLQHITDEGRLPPLDNKLDPNKIFNSDTSALRSLAADQNKATKLFEKRFFEGLSDKGKIGLNEMDIMAMQALTTARSAIANIQKEQIGIKKNIADLKIKQQQSIAKAATGGGTGNDVVNNNLGASDIGRSILDNIFNTPGVTSMTTASVENNGAYQTADLDTASSLLDEITNMNNSDNNNIIVSPSVKYESLNPKTYVAVGDTDDDVEFRTYSSDGELLSDYPNPTTTISSINRDSKTATDELLMEYPLLHK